MGTGFRYKAVPGREEQSFSPPVELRLRNCQDPPEVRLEAKIAGEWYFLFGFMDEDSGLVINAGNLGRIGIRKNYLAWSTEEP